MINVLLTVVAILSAAAGAAYAAAPRFRKGHGVSILIPFRCSDKFSSRVRNVEWLKKYWAAQFPGAEIILGDDSGEPFSKSAAVNNAASKASGDVFVIVDADGYVPANAVLHCVREIRRARKRGRRLWFVPYRKFYRLTEEASCFPLESDPASPYVFPSPPDGDSILGDTDPNVGHWYGAMIQIMPREAFELVGGWDERFCVDDSTQILTQQGWKFYQELRVGDAVLTLNHNTGLSEWQPVKAVNVYYGQHKMLSIESKTHSSLTTMNHNWPIICRPDYRSKTGWGSKEETRGWATSSGFTSESMVPMAAPHATLPAVAKYSDAIVECVAWFWTEGSISRLRNGHHGRNVAISQSIVVNPDKCERIRTVLIKAFGKPSSFPRRGASIAPDIPRWNERPDRRNVIFNLNAEAGSILQKYAPNRVPSHDFLLSLTKPQLDLFIECSILGDGHVRPKNGETALGQKNPAAIDTFQFACILAGHCTSVHTEKTIKGYDYGMTALRIRQQDRFKLCKGKHTAVMFEGVVWCPTTENKTWLARRKGKTYFTGNSGWGGEDHAAMRAMDTLYWTHKTLSNQVLHLWHPQIGPQGVREWVHWKERMWENQSGIGVNDRLSHRYYAAQGKPRMMRKLVDEGHHEPKHHHHHHEPPKPKHHKRRHRHHHHHHRPSV